MHGNAFALWSSIDCNVARQGYSHPDVVKERARSHAPYAVVFALATPSRPTWQCGDVPGPYIELEGRSSIERFI